MRLLCLTEGGMDTRTKTTAGVLVWTPAPVHTSPTNSVIPQGVWKDQDGDQAEIEDDFDSQMDENGIIGLSEALENVHFRETFNLNPQCNQTFHSTHFTSKHANASGCKRETPPEDLSNGPHLSDIESLDDDLLSSENAWAKNKAINRKKGRRSLQSCGPHTQAGASNHHSPVSPFATGFTFPHLLHFTAEELAAAPGIDAETFPEADLIESLLDSHSSLKSSPRCPRKSDKEEQEGRQIAAICPEQELSRTFLKSRQSPDRKTVTHATKSRTKPAEVNESKKGHLSYRTPDFSKVEPRVCFPKNGYMPPKSRLPSKKEFLSSASPLIFKSPAEIVKEVLLDASDEPSSPSVCDKATPSYTVPYDFRCRQQATTLLEQLQEDYNRLLTKYAEAENTIDRLRLEAKVNMFSDLPNPRHSAQLGLNHNTSKLVTLDFAQTQRAENEPAPYPSGHSSPQSDQVDTILCVQADRFLQQLQTYQDVLRREKLKPSEQIKLVEGLNSLERGYLLARDEYKHSQQQGGQVSLFDPERELERLIYQCGLHLDELKEQVHEMQQEEHMCDSVSSPSSEPTCVPSEEDKTLTLPKTPPVPLLVKCGEAVKVEVSSASEETDADDDDDDDMEAEDEITYKSFYLKAVTGKNKNDQQGSSTVVDHYQSFTKSPRTFGHDLLEEGALSTALKNNNQPETVEKQRQGTENMDTQKSLQHRKVKSVNPYHSSPHASKQQTSGFFATSNRTSTNSMMPVHVSSSSRRFDVGRSHSSSLSSVGEISASEQKISRHQSKSSNELFQDGVISPETDSGFVGSETSHLKPAVVQAPLHQRAPESVRIHMEEKTEKPIAVSTTSTASPLHSRIEIEPRGASHFNPDKQRRSRQGQRRRTLSCSPQHWLSQTEQSRVDSGTSRFRLDNDSSHSVSEDGQRDLSVTSIHSSSQSSAPSMHRHHGISLQAPGSSQGLNRNDAVQLLQTEVTTLKERLESFLRQKKPHSSRRAAPSAPCYTHVRSRDEEQKNVRRARGHTSTDDEFEELRPTTRSRSASAGKQKAQPEKLTVSELRTPTLPPQMSRCTQTLAAEKDDYLNTDDVHRTQHRQHSDVSVQVTGTQPDRTCKAPLCPHVSSNNTAPSQTGSAVNHFSHFHHCPACGQTNQQRSFNRDCCRGADSFTCTSCQPAESPDREFRSRFVAAPPALLPCMTMCPSPILLYPSPVCVSPSNNYGEPSVVRGRVEVRDRHGRSLSSGKQSSLDSSLNRAIRAARHMKHTSRHMARSLADGIEYQELLSQSCSY